MCYSDCPRPPGRLAREPSPQRCPLPRRPAVWRDGSLIACRVVELGSRRDFRDSPGDQTRPLRTPRPSSIVYRDRYSTATVSSRRAGSVGKTFSPCPCPFGTSGSESVGFRRTPSSRGWWFAVDAWIRAGKALGFKTPWAEVPITRMARVRAGNKPLGCTGKESRKERREWR